MSDNSSTSTALSILLSELDSEVDDVEVKNEESNNTIEGAEEDYVVEDRLSSSPIEGIDAGQHGDRNEGQTEDRVLRETLEFGERKSFTSSSSFRPRDENGEKIFPIRGSGQVDTILVSADDNTFSVYLELDGKKVIESESWSDLDTKSNELPHINAYQKTSGEYIVVVNDYPFNEEVDFSITPAGDTSFNTVRAEIMVDEYTTGGK